jgi:MSHA pilin protein MshA
MSRLKDERGFTLIELVIIIVILGILSVVAIPRYVDMQEEAREASIRGALGNIRSAVSIQYARNALSGTPSFPAALNGTLFADGKVPEEPVSKVTTVVTSFNGSGGWVYDSGTGRVQCNLAAYSSYQDYQGAKPSESGPADRRANTGSEIWGRSPS